MLVMVSRDIAVKNRRYGMLMSADNLYETTKLQAWILIMGPGCGSGEPKMAEDR